MTTQGNDHVATSTRGASENVLRDLAPKGVLRAAINLGMPVLAELDPVTGKPRGVSVDLATELARQLGVGLECVPYPAAGKVVAAVNDDAWDVAFLAIDPTRAEHLAYSEPYVLLEGTCVVRADSKYQSIDDLDQPGVRIAVGKGAAYDLYLTRELKQVTLVRADTSAQVVATFDAEKLEAGAGVRQPLERAARDRPDLRVLPGSFTVIGQAMAVPRGHDAGLQRVRAFIDEIKRGGFVADALRRHNQEATLA